MTARRSLALGGELRGRSRVFVDGDDRAIVTRSVGCAGAVRDLPARFRRVGMTRVQRMAGRGLVASAVVLGVIALGAVGSVVFGGEHGLTLVDVEPALLAVGDVPRGYMKVAWQSAPDGSLTRDQLDAPAQCEAVLDSFGLVDGSGQAIGSRFESEDGGFIEHTLALSLRQDFTMKELQDGYDTCGSFAFDDGELSGWFSISAERVEDIGDEALLVVAQVSTRVDGRPVAGEMNGILWQREGVHAFVAFSGGYDDLSGATMESRPIDGDVLRATAKAADAKLRVAVDG